MFKIILIKLLQFKSQSLQCSSMTDHLHTVGLLYLTLAVRHATL